MTQEERRSIQILKTPVLSLRPLEKSDKRKVCRWMTSSYILHNSFVIPSAKSLPDDFATLSYAERYFTMLLADRKRLTYAIMNNNLHIGNVGLKEIELTKMTAECFIEIGEAQFRGKGFGEGAMALMLENAFQKLGLSSIVLDVLEFNFPALKIYQRLGFNFVCYNDWHYDEFGLYWRVLKMQLEKNDWLMKRYRAAKSIVF